MANVSSSNNQGVRVPKLRFPGFKGEWEEKTMDKAFDEIVEKNRPELPVLSILQGVGTVLRDNSDRRISYDKANLNSYKVMNKGDFIIHLRSFEGGLECSKHHGISSPAYKILRSNCLIPEAYEDYFHSYNFIQGKLSIAVTGIRDGKSIDMSSFWSIKIAIPNTDEQNKIASFLSLLNKRIEKQRRLVEALKSYKRGALSKLFPQKGEVTPKYRLAGFTEPWGQRKLGELGAITTGNTPSTSVPDYYSDDGIVWVTPTDISENIIFESARKLSELGRQVGRVVPKNTILVTCIASIGKNTMLGTTGSFNQQINGLTPDEDKYDPYFLLTESSLWSAQMKNSAAAGTMQIVNRTEFSKLKTWIPNLKEQKQIGNFFRRLDDLITLHQREQNEIEVMKSGLLQQLFI